MVQHPLDAETFSNHALVALDSSYLGLLAPTHTPYCLQGIPFLLAKEAKAANTATRKNFLTD